MENTGHTCTCFKYHKWPIYLFAHWDDVLVHICPRCERKIEIKSGLITEIKPGIDQLPCAIDDNYYVSGK